MKLLTRGELGSLNILQNMKDQYVNAINSFDIIFRPLLQEALTKAGYGNKIQMSKEQNFPDDLSNTEDYWSYLTYGVQGKKTLSR